MGNNFGFPSGDFSIVVWAKLSPGDTASTFIAGKHVSGYPNGYFLHINMSDAYGIPGKSYFYCSALPGQEANSVTITNDGGWHQHVGVYHAGGSMEIYIDGAPVEGVNTSPPMVGNPAAFMIGAHEDHEGPLNSLDGWVDEVQLYNNAITSEDAQFLYEHPSQVVPEPVTFSLLLIGGVALLRRQRS